MIRAACSSVATTATDCDPASLSATSSSLHATMMIMIITCLEFPSSEISISTKGFTCGSTIIRSSSSSSAAAPGPQTFKHLYIMVYLTMPAAHRPGYLAGPESHLYPRHSPYILSRSLLSLAGPYYINFQRKHEPMNLQHMNMLASAMALLGHVVRFASANTSSRGPVSQDQAAQVYYATYMYIHTSSQPIQASPLDFGNTFGEYRQPVPCAGCLPCWPNPAHVMAWNSTNSHAKKNATHSP